MSLVATASAAAASDPSVEVRTTPRAAWDQFTAEHSGWAVRWSPDRERVHRAFGAGISVSGPIHTADQAAEAALRFLRRETAITKAATADLRVNASVKRQRVWYVHLRQHHDGLPLLFDDVTVRLWEDGRVFVFGSDVRDDIDLDTRPRLDAAQAREAARAGLEGFDATGDEVRAGDELFVLPPQARGERYRLVRRVLARQFAPRHEWILYVDAHSGEVAWRMDRVRTAIVRGFVKSETHPRVPSDALVAEAIPFAAVTIDGVDAVSDETGWFRSHNVVDEVDVVFELRGPFGEAVRADTPEVRASESFRVEASAGARFDFTWDDTNSQADERDAFTHAMHTYRYLKELDPETTALDYPMPVRVNVEGECNAFWDGESINFFSAGGGCNSSAQMLDVVAHEYGHGINDKLYIANGSFDGMRSGSLHEALADVTAGFLTDDPIMGDEFFENGNFIRRLDNDNQYSRDVVGETHRDGLILGGAMWELRQRIGLETTERLAHFARYGKPDGLSTEVDEVFAEYLLEVLVADDDDGNLANGTPHSTDILESFALHGISVSLIADFENIVEHDVANPATGARIAVDVIHPGRRGEIDPASVRLHYRVNRNPRVRTLPMANVVDETYEATLPVLSAGVVVEYWFDAALGQFEPATWPSDARAPRPRLLVGQPVVLFEDDFGGDQGWTVGAGDDDATDAVWERGVAELVRTASGWPRGDCQPQGDHTFGYGLGSERISFVTGATRVPLLEDPDQSDPLLNDVDGQTTLTSPVLDMAGLRAPVVDFRYWFSNNFGGARYEDRFGVDISNDAGQTWVSVIDTATPTTAPGLRADQIALAAYSPWRQVLVRVKDYLPATNRMQLRFVVADRGDDSVVEALIDDFRVLEFADAVPVAVSGFSATWHFDHVRLRWETAAAFDATLRAVDGERSWDVPLAALGEAFDRSGAWRPGSTVSYQLLHAAEVLATVAVEIPGVGQTALRTPSPNPFNPRVTIPFELASRARVRLTIVDVAGRRVRQLHDGWLEAGLHRQPWTGRDDEGRSVASGVYYALLEEGSRRYSRKLTLVR